MKIDVSPLAYEDLKNIRDYIRDSLCNPAAAERTARKITQAYMQLADSPFIGSPLKNKINVETRYRYLVSGNYLIFYVVEEERAIISRIIFGKRDYANIVFKNYLDDNQDNQ